MRGCSFRVGHNHSYVEQKGKEAKVLAGLINSFPVALIALPR